MTSVDLVSPIAYTIGLDPRMGSRDATSPSLGPDSTDLELLHAVQSGQTQALTWLYRRYVRLVYSLAIRILDNSQEAEDLTQEIFVTFWQKKAFDPSRGRLSTYLSLLTRSRALDRKRSQGSYQALLERYQTNAPTVSRSVPFDRLALSERQDVTRTALAQLPDTQRQVLEMSYYEGLSQAAIAQALDLPLGTVKTRSRQGLLKLRRLLGDYLG